MGDKRNSRGLGRRATYGYSLTELCQDDEVENERTGKEGVFASIVTDYRVASVHEDLRDVLVHCSLRVCYVGHVFDYNLAVMTG